MNFTDIDMKILNNAQPHMKWKDIQENTKKILQETKEDFNFLNLKEIEYLLCSEKIFEILKDI